MSVYSVAGVTDDGPMRTKRVKAVAGVTDDGPMRTKRGGKQR